MSRKMGKFVCPAAKQQNITKDKTNGKNRQKKVKNRIHVFTYKHDIVQN